jgi:hypothetical protein
MTGSVVESSSKSDSKPIKISLGTEKALVTKIE